VSGLDLGVVGNCIVAALVDERGTIVWHCHPRIDGDPVFCGLLEPRAGPAEGRFAIELQGLASTRRRYIDNSAVLETLLLDGQGRGVRITDFAPRFRQYDRVFRPPMLVRRLEPVGGTPLLTVRLRPLFDYGAAVPQRIPGSNHLRFVAAAGALRVTTDLPIAMLEREAPFVLMRPAWLVLGPDESFAASLDHTCRDFLERTLDHWCEWSRCLSVPFEWQEAVIRAAITLKLCSFEETGAIVAALTTSIPEAPGTARTWDYRYCWLRDAFFVVQALNRLGATRTMEDYLGWVATVMALEPGRELKPVYGIVPSEPLPERIVPALAGYRGQGPVRIGNQAAEQRQNDSYGSVVLAVAQMFYDQRLPRRGDLALFRTLEGLGEIAARVALEPDAGLWEYRGRRAVHTHSAAMCWAACHHLGKIASRLGLPDRASHWRGEAERIRKAILAEAWRPDLGSFVATFGGSGLDASLLLLHEIGFLSTDDPRFAGTVEAIGRRLRRNGHLHRYDEEDDFGLPETAFNICTFWYIEALAALGRREEARALFEQMLAARTSLGLLSEDTDSRTGEPWGNFPQTYSMVGLITSAMRLSKSWEEAFWRGS
jgi:GH15 family glucan-1,4-alpha-glucosidase